MKRLVSLLLTSLCVVPLFGQDDFEEPPVEVSVAPQYRLTNRLTWVEVGGQHSYDDFLSNTLYEGLHLGIGVEQHRNFSVNAPYVKYNGFLASLDLGTNPSENHSMVVRKLRAYYGAHYKMEMSEAFSIFLGSFTCVNFGSRILAHNENNPVNNIRDLNQWASAMFSFNIVTPRKGRKIHVMDHVSAPFLGVMLSPKYNETSFDMGESEDATEYVVVTSFPNCLQFRNVLSIDTPLTKNTTLRLGYVVERQKYKVNDLEGRSLNNSFQVGIVHNVYNFKGKEPIPSNCVTPF